MTDRWARAEERYRQREADRRYRRDDQAWAEHERRVGYGRAASDADSDEWDDYDYDTTVIPRYSDEEPPYDDHPLYDDEYDDEYDDDDLDEDPEPAPPPRTRSARGTAAAAQSAADRSGRRAQPQRTGPRRADSVRGESVRSSARGKKRSRVAARKAEERKRRRRTMWVIGALLAVLLVGAVGVAAMRFAESMSGPQDYAGPAGPLVVVQVHPGDTAQQIASTMVEKDVVKSSGAFYEAAVRNTNMNSVQPGYYAIPSKSPAADAVLALLAKGSRVGNLVVSEGRLLHDQHDVNTGARKEGIYTKIAAASCVGTGAAQKCVTADQLAAAGASADLAALGVPSWAEQSVRAAPDRSRQLEGLIAAGTWDFDPSGTPQQIIKQLIGASSAGYESTGLLQSGAETKLSPYETLIAASLVEREALPQDMPKVARVIVNRLKAGQQLEFDSTVNYALDRTEVATTDSDRATKTPWNTYAMTGLPANPIAAPSLNALRAMENPEPGPWLYFVTIDTKGTTLFTQSYAEHLRNIQKAEASGILDSGR
ncbi:endolytic transglycosylase MltG [Nocardia arizonensis]|uniref:endolytic transglycosylase MltG n=1 Tax=Nocardia arizonensis TaxID=1141647 RepID=UPI0006D1534F|nr:endolytic transglycosylase MltG [Nocardia arizonensis]